MVLPSSSIIKIFVNKMIESNGNWLKDHHSHRCNYVRIWIFRISVFSSLTSRLNRHLGNRKLFCRRRQTISTEDRMHQPRHWTYCQNSDQLLLLSMRGSGTMGIARRSQDWNKNKHLHVMVGPMIRRIYLYSLQCVHRVRITSNKWLPKEIQMREIFFFFF